MKGFSAAVERLRERVVEMPTVDKKLSGRLSSVDDMACSPKGADRMRLMRNASLELARELDR
jgi:hypothetical protein